MWKTLPVLSVLLLSLLLVACPEEEDEGVCADEDRAEPIPIGEALDGESGVLSFRFDALDPDPPDLGENDWTVTVLDASGSPVDGCSLLAEPWMPDHGHGSEDPSGEALSEPGQYLIPGLELVMPGFWTVSVSADCDSVSDVRIYNICVEG